MTEKEPLHGLNCPRCGGVVPIPEGQAIVRCPYCDLRSFVRGEHGLRRFQVAQSIQRDNLVDILRKFLSGNFAIASNTARNARLKEIFLVYLPFWTVWSHVAAWAFGEEKVGSGDHAHYEPREIRVVQEVTWNGAACDVGEFGVTAIPLNDQDLAPFNPQALHESGMVFEPVGVFSEAQRTAERQFEAQVRHKASLDRMAQLFLRFFRRRAALVYFPLWVIRYLYRGRAFQVVVDGRDGKVLYGKAPGNTLYRAAILVAGMAVGAFLAIDIPAFLLASSGRSDDNSGIFWLILAIFIAGAGLMVAAYRTFRYGEEYEYRSAVLKKAAVLPPDFENPLGTITSVKDLEKWIDRLS